MLFQLSKSGWMLGDLLHSFPAPIDLKQYAQEATECELHTWAHLTIHLEQQQGSETPFAY